MAGGQSIANQPTHAAIFARNDVRGHGRALHQVVDMQGAVLRAGEDKGVRVVEAGLHGVGRVDVPGAVLWVGCSDNGGRPVSIGVAMCRHEHHVPRHAPFVVVQHLPRRSIQEPNHAVQPAQQGAVAW